MVSVIIGNPERFFWFVDAQRFDPLAVVPDPDVVFDFSRIGMLGPNHLLVLVQHLWIQAPFAQDAQCAVAETDRHIGMVNRIARQQIAGANETTVADGNCLHLKLFRLG